MNEVTRRRILQASPFAAAAAFGATAPLTVGAQQNHDAVLSPAHAGRGAALLFDVRQYGAAGDGKTLDTKAVNAAIDAAAKAGGGTVVFPAGLYLCFSIHLQSYVDLWLQQGATIVAADSPKPGEATGYNGETYDAAEPKTSYDAYQDYGHNHWHNSLLWGENIHDFGIFGNGLIWGRGLSNGRSHTDLGYKFVAEQAGVGNKAIALKNCRNVTFRDFSILKGGHFGFLLTGVDNCTVDNVKIDTDRDGIDIDCCQNVRVSNCTVNSPWDDGICPKSSFALGYARPTRNVTITNCYVTGCYELGSVLDGTFKKFTVASEGQMDRGVPHTGRIKCGTESNGGFINITVSNCVFEGCQGYALESVDGALMEDIAITNTTMRDCVSAPIFVRLGARLRGPKESTKVGTAARILFSNIESYNSASKIASILSGVPGHAVEDVKLSDIYVHNEGGGTDADRNIAVPEKENAYPEPGMFGRIPATGFFLRHVRNVEMSHIEVRTAAPDARSPFYLQDVERADFFALNAPRANGTPLFQLQDVRDLRLGWTRGVADTNLEHADAQTLG
ncbi:rhamnogalacturonidase [Terriglobus aquaticus]|uniref:Glycoside hydrolase family 28 protein n=1 Tax=Terriglobus aquaticus TaxID=940139 RepID=A0ABW9KNF8_9BACT|nr:glycosyl hydrolase family 28-related protein [Terriglobus aquaticus]